MHRGSSLKQALGVVKLKSPLIISLGLLLVLAGLTVAATVSWRSKPREKRISALEKAKPQPQKREVELPPAEPAAAPTPVSKTVTISKKLTEFQSACWPGAAQVERYASEPLARFSVQVPTNQQASTPFDFCIQEVKLGDVALTWLDGGVVSGEMNALQINGVFFPVSDRHTFWSIPVGGKSFEGYVQQGQPLCVKGVAPQVEGAQYSEFWGASVAMEFRSGMPNGEVILVNPTFDRISVVLSGSAIPSVRLWIENNLTPTDSNAKRWCVGQDQAPSLP